METKNERFLDFLQDKQLLGTLDIPSGHPTSVEPTAWYGEN